MYLSALELLHPGEASLHFSGSTILLSPSLDGVISSQDEYPQGHFEVPNKVPKLSTDDLEPRAPN